MLKSLDLKYTNIRSYIVNLSWSQWFPKLAHWFLAGPAVDDYEVLIADSRGTRYELTSHMLTPFSFINNCIKQHFTNTHSKQQLNPWPATATQMTENE